ncbi:hypothetical protein IV203_029387 [Nitzschia inconspicua]|uniref:Small-subunit processome Utp12 domain-containing protein n=1 Tax=Nitzschia inconspicua TaxID=303405 RepID=A0A9K3Q0D2_9STRA|nr:hypothetical protein IV203_029387 [Nitzschia inconspicua]
MTSSTTLLQSAVSPDGSVVAIVAPSASSSSSRHVIQIYQVSETSTSLQLTLTHTSNQSMEQLVFVGKSLVLGRLGHHEVVVWDLHRGVVATKLLAADDQSFLAVASNAASDDRYYILVRNGPKLYIQEYQVANHKLVRKIKSGHLHEGEVDAEMEDMESTPNLATMVVTSSHLAVRTRDSGIRIMSQDTGKKVGKMKIKSLNGAETALDMAVCEGNPNTLAVVQDAGNATTVLYDMSSCKEVVRVSPKKATSSGDSECHLQLVVASESNDQRYTLLRNNVLLSVDASSSSHELLTQLSSDHPVALFLRKTKVLALMYQRGAECEARWVSHGEDESSSSLPAVVALDQEPEPHDQQQSDRAGAKKRKPTETTVLGPGQAGMETASSVKKVRVNEDNDDEEMGKDEAKVDEHDDEEDDDDENDEGQNMTIAERLAMLKEALDEDADDGDDDDHVDEDEEGVDFVASDKTTISFKPKRATTESLKELLSQALQSSEDNLLELALMVRDVKIIATTLKEMDGELLVILLGKLTSRLASSPLRAESLSVWISHCLKRGTFHPEHLAVLRNLLYERIESFSDLLRLEGRLSMMVD